MMNSVQAPRVLPRLLHRAHRLFSIVFPRLTIGVRGIVLSENREVLLVKHSYMDGWHLPGGGVKRGEALIAALARELREESGVEMTGPPELYGVYFNSKFSSGDHVILFVVRAFRKTEPRANFEIIDHGFFPLGQLPDDTTASTRARIAEVTYGGPAPEHW